MKIRKNNNLIQIDSSKAKTIYPLTEKVKVPDGVSIALTKNDMSLDGVKRLISDPGEYETEDVFVYVLDSAEGKTELFVLDSDDMTIMIADNTVPKFNHANFDKINSIDILICVIDGDNYEELSNLIDEIEPSVLMVTGMTDSLVEGFIKKMSLIPSEDVQSTYSFNAEGFESEMQAAMRILILK